MLPSAGGNKVYLSDQPRVDAGYGHGKPHRQRNDEKKLPPCHRAGRWAEPVKVLWPDEMHNRNGWCQQPSLEERDTKERNERSRKRTVCHKHTHTHTHTHMHIDIHTHAFTHTYTHIHARTRAHTPCDDATTTTTRCAWRASTTQRQPDERGR